MVTHSGIKMTVQAFDEYDSDEEYDDEDFFSDDLCSYTDTMSDFEDK